MKYKLVVQETKLLSKELYLRLYKVNDAGPKRAGTVQTTKMASKMASELMFRIIHEKPFNNAIVSVLESSTMSISECNTTEHSKDFYVDDSRTYINGEINPNLIFELFGSFSAETAITARNCMINSIENDMQEFKNSCKMALQLKQISGEEWLDKMRLPTTPGDELCLFVLGRLYFRHSAVVNKYNIWCIVDTSMRITKQKLLDWSSIRLLYFGNNRYGILRPKTGSHYTPSIPPYNPVLTGRARMQRLPYGQRARTYTRRPVRGLTTISRGYTYINQPIVQSTYSTRNSVRGFNTRGRGLSRIVTQTTSRIYNSPATLMRGSMRPRGRMMGFLGVTNYEHNRFGTNTNVLSGTTSQYVDLTASTQHSPARPIDRVATIPGYDYGTTKWTTSNWQRPDSIDSDLSPEVSALLKTIGKGKVSTPVTTSPELIELDTDDPSESTPSNEKSDNQKSESVQSPCDPISSDDSTTELLNELNLDITAISAASTCSKEPTSNPADKNVVEQPETQNLPPIVPSKNVLTGNMDTIRGISTDGLIDTVGNRDSVEPAKNADSSVNNKNNTVIVDTTTVKDEPMTENKMHIKIPKLELKLELETNWQR